MPIICVESWRVWSISVSERILPPPPPKAGPVYDPTGVSFAVREAVTKFQGPWGARLGQGRPYEGIGREHWTRVKALNRRIAGELSDEYDRLRPVADLVARLTESVSRFLDEPSNGKVMRTTKRKDRPQ